MVLQGGRHPSQQLRVWWLHPAKTPRNQVFRANCRVLILLLLCACWKFSHSSKGHADCRWDWYATLCAIGGVSPVDTSAAKAGLPAVDSIDMSPWLLGATTESPRKILLLGTEPRSSNLSSALPCTNFATSPVYDASWGGVERSTGNCTTVSGVIVDEGAGGLWKLVTGAEEQYSQTGPTYPNASTTVDTRAPQFTRDCNRGCLFNLLIGERRCDPLSTFDRS